MQIHLRREGDFVVVEVRADDGWVEVIRERDDGPFSHIVDVTARMGKRERMGMVMDGAIAAMQAIKDEGAPPKPRRGRP